ncbi:MAG: serine/threonine protein kinase, partial [Thermoguttaceae bacterium]|nr:serine/threonine protein kinase [Thermoguttaceae bacterium]
MSELSVDDLTQRLLSLDLLDMGKIRDVENSFGSQNFTAEQFLQSAQRLGYLTKYQVERLASGETTGFYYGDYRIQYMIGSGSFARVFRCVHKTTGKVVAVKVLRARFREDKTAIDEFTREAELGVELRHPNVAAVYESKSTKYDHFMVMDFIEGRTLREEVKAQKNGIVEPKRATRIVTDVCSALDYAFKRGYQHRDMKLSNIMLSSSGKAVLLDFGLLADDNNSNWKNQRAIEYAALERTTRVRRDDKRSDVYFLGAIFYQLLTGVAPLGEVKERAKRLDSARFRNVRPIRDVAPFVPRVLAFIVEKA